MIAAFPFAIIHAQLPNSYSLESFNTSHGLSSSEVISLEKDKNGFLWIGTSAGVSRYDGYEFQNYHRTKDHELIGFVNVIVRDKKNYLWIGSDAGLFLYDYASIIKVSASTSAPQGINDILPDSNGTLWLATGNGPAKIQVTDSLLKGTQKINIPEFVFHDWKFHNLGIDDRRTDLIKKAPDGTVYFTRQSTLYKYVNDKILTELDIPNRRDKILFLLPISASKVFLNTVQTDIHRVENGVHTNIQHKELYKQGVDDELPGVWFNGTFGLYYFHPQTAVVSRYINVLDKSVIWTNNMLVDDNFFWVTSYEGLIKIKPSIFTIHDTRSVLPKHPDFYSILQRKDGNLLFGSNRGNLLQKTDNGFEVIEKEVVTLSELKGLFEDRRGWLWVASGYQGITLIREKQRTRFTEADGLHDNSFSQFLETSKGKLYAIGDQGVTEIIVDEKENVLFNKYHFPPNTTKHAKFLTGIEGPDGSIWIGGEEGLLHLINDTLKSYAIEGRKVSVKDIKVDQSGKIWIATDGEGIFRCKFNGNDQLQIEKKYTDADGLPTLHYLGLLVDKENNIWAGSYMGISFIGQNKKHFGEVLNFTESDGFFKPAYYSLRFYQTLDSVIWTVTSAGIASFKPTDFFLSAQSPNAHITSIHQLKTNEQITDTSIKKFLYNDNSFNFTYVALNYANQSGTRYFYKLEGLDSNWISAGTSRSINYGNLPPNKYVFRVKALNNKGRWSEKDATYSFTITPPFWKTWWFLGSAISILTIIAVLLFRRRIAYIKTKADIQRQLMGLEIRALRSQMNPHFIFNSLNAISQLVASKRNDEGLQYLSKFSKLLRLVLDESEKSYITLKDEIKILDLYLQLETLRFGSSFSYTMHADDELDEEETLLPSFLIHPIIENAIWHGLLHKEGDRRLIISFAKKGNDKLICVVKDNGIGIEAATLKKQQQLNGEKQQSKGLKMVRERLSLLKEQNNASADFKMEDLKDHDGYISGTKCTLEIPVLYE